MRLTDLTVSQAAEAVREYDDKHAELDRRLWGLSRKCRQSLLDGQSSSAIEELVWTLKSFWQVQFVTTDTKKHMAQALTYLEWSPQIFDQPTKISEDADEYAYNLVSNLVSTTKELSNSRRREFSLASKTLHWLLPWRIPVYDSFVRRSLDIPNSWDYPKAYRMLTQRLFEVARKFEKEDPFWMGEVGPKSILRGLDKSLWWLNGGNKG